MSRSLSIFLLSVLTVPALAQQVEPPREIRESRTSGIRYFTSNYGVFGQNSAAPMQGPHQGFFYPRGPEEITYMFGSGLWFGARKSAGDTLLDLSFLTDDSHGQSGSATPGSWSPGPAPLNTSINLIAYSPEYHRSIGRFLDTTASRPAWPLWYDGMTSVTMRHPGSYVADSAGRAISIWGSHRPAFVPGVAEQFFSRYHDGDTSAYHFVSSGYRGPAIGLIEQNVYSFSDPGLDNTVILHYRIINVSGDTLHDCYAANAADPEIGSSIVNDRASFYFPRPELATGVVWSEREAGPRPGVLLTTLLESPAIDGAGFIRHDRRVYDTSEQTGLGAFDNMVITEEGKNRAKLYRMISWAGIDGDNGAGDKRTVLVTRPFDMRPGDTVRFALAFTVLADVIDYSGGIDQRIEAGAERVIALYRSGRGSGAPDGSSITEAISIGKIHPNPASESALIDLFLERRGLVSIRVADALGREVLTLADRMMEAGDSSVTLDLSGLVPGAYVVSVESGGKASSQRLVVLR